eukprot:TRINITY_DN23619_c0_g1_i2.p1 TRINITY_DN23619_c0_g1~~TRINITY_DN23619_c0_g1_i2.p1  ORF type:complete len:311 (+),score=37.13 TRINITY_DN23619_c0_g1_i2:141-935(+)
MPAAAPPPPQDAAAAHAARCPPPPLAHSSAAHVAADLRATAEAITRSCEERLRAKQAAPPSPPAPAEPTPPAATGPPSPPPGPPARTLSPLAATSLAGSMRGAVWRGVRTLSPLSQVAPVWSRRLGRTLSPRRPHNRSPPRSARPSSPRPAAAVLGALRVPPPQPLPRGPPPAPLPGPAEPPAAAGRVALLLARYAQVRQKGSRHPRGAAHWTPPLAAPRWRAELTPQRPRAGGPESPRRPSSGADCGRGAARPGEAAPLIAAG